MKPGKLQKIVELRRGPIRSNANGTSTYAWATIRLECGHIFQSSALRGIHADVPARVRCTLCVAAGIVDR